MLIFIFLYSCFLRVFFGVFFCTQSYDIQIIFNRSISPLDGTVTSITTMGQGGPGSNGNIEVLHTPKISRTEPSLSDGV